MSEFTIDDMIASAIEKKPDTFKDAFNDIMAQKVAAAVQSRKEELAQTLFNDSDETPEQDSEEIENETTAQSEEDLENTEAEDQDG